MDPLTQGLVGATLPQSAARPRQVAAAGLLGLLAGMAPDLDVLIRSEQDPLLFLEYHRQFTHSLIFIVPGGLLCALLLHPLFGRRLGLRFREAWLFCTLGFATHALLDACTTYGTQLFWPFTDLRVAWHTISIIDPLFTLPILVCVVLAWRKRQPAWARVGLVWGLAYLGLGLIQRDAAIEMGRELAAARGHTPTRLEAKPSFANIVVWKIVYETEDAFYVDAVRTGPTPRIYVGDQLPKLDLERDFPWLDHASQQARDIQRFAWFSNGYVARDPEHPLRIIDIRYSLLPNEVRALWSLQLDRDAPAGEHADYVTHRDPSGGRAGQLWQMVTGG
jgi:inner membrane protein